ncbi:MAG: hypothetical protein QOF29_1256, partial [bacterium]
MAAPARSAPRPFSEPFHALDAARWAPGAHPLGAASGTSGTVLLTTYADGAQTHHEARRLGFDPTAAPHEPMNLYVNAWFPRWLGGVAPGQTRAMAVHGVDADPR